MRAPWRCQVRAFAKHVLPRIWVYGALLAVVLGVLWVRTDEPRVEYDPLAKLRRMRAVTPDGGPRLSIDQTPSTTNAALDAAAHAKDSLLAIEAWAIRAIDAGRDPAALHAAALIDLRWSESPERLVGRAIELLEAAARLVDHDASVLSDLAAAYMTAADHGGDARTILRAIDVAERALAIDWTYQPARFNLTLALHRAGFVSEEVRVGRTYLSLDSTSGWAHAVRTLILTVPPTSPAALMRSVNADSAAVARFVKTDHQTAREFGWNVVLAHWGERITVGDTVGAQQQLLLAQLLGWALVRDGGDATLLDAVATLRRTTNASRAQAATAHRELAAANERYKRSDYAGAQAAAVRALTHASELTTLRSWALVVLGGSLVHNGGWEEGARSLRDALALVNPVRHAALVGRAHATLATGRLRSGLDDLADAEIALAEHYLTTAGEREQLGAIQMMRADAMLGRGDAAGYDAALRSLVILRQHPRSVWRHNALYVLAEETLAEGWSAVAARAQDEGVAAAAGTGEPLDLAEALLARARLRSVTGNGARVADDVNVARRLIANAVPGGDRQWLEADLHLSEALAMLGKRPVKAIELADSAVAFFRARWNVLRLAPALGVRAEARAAAGLLDSALADLSLAATLLDERAARMPSLGARTLLLSEARRVLDRIVLLQLAKGNVAGAFASVERTRALLSSDRSARSAIDQGRTQLARGETGVEYFRIADTLLTWTVSDAQEVHLTRSVIDGPSLARMLGRARAELELRRPDSVSRPLLAELYHLLIAPIRGRLGQPGGQLVIAADGELAAVPFAGLYDARRGRYVVEDHSIRMVSSLAEASDRAAPGSKRATATLLVADPAFDATEYPLLERLPGATAEVSALTETYPHHVLLQGDAARRDVLTREMGRAGIVHYAGHAVFDAARPERSHLVLAARTPHSPRDRGLSQLAAAEVATLHLRHIRLVVLSACQTFGVTGEAVGGTGGLAGAFKAAGVGGVVGSTWRVDDALTEPMMLEFHRFYAASGDGPGALRSAQLRMLQDTAVALRSPAAWAGFAYAGR